MRLLLVDNYDSYTHNLAHLVAEVTGVVPLVLPNDDRGLQELDLGGFVAAIVSPGPGHPANERDFGWSRRLFDVPTLPVLGVCLGHQGLAVHAGGRVVPAPAPKHGHVTQVRHGETGLFAGLPQNFRAVRYHSLAVQLPLPATLEALAWAEDNVLMALRHRTRPHYGVQFHPESICTEFGARLLSNFMALHVEQRVRVSVARNAPYGVHRSAREAPPRAASSSVGSPALEVFFRSVASDLSPEQVYAELFCAAPCSYWLDSARTEPGLSRFSFMGAPTAAHGGAGELLSYRCGDGFVHVRCGESSREEPGDIWSALRRRLQPEVAGREALPFVFGGYVGYFGYELKAELGGAPHHRAEQPDAMFMQADRFLAFDHLHGRTYVVAIAAQEAQSAAQRWVRETLSTLQAMPVRNLLPAPPAPAQVDLERFAATPRSDYARAIERARAYLLAGESYEICLTNRFLLPAPAQEFAFYQRLRRLNPAPYAALLRLPGLTVHSSSPERFLCVGPGGAVETKPIKGTAARHVDPERDAVVRDSLSAEAKTRAENLMICDLLRNDLARVCSPGSVRVPHFMAVESYATVHQLVSTVRGQLRPGLTAIDVVRACFPGGSMTGAPKLRTLEIIDRLEGRARGVYSGALGYLSYGGAADLSIVIRTAVSDGRNVSIGAGGAIVLASDVKSEYEEMLLKADAVARAL